MKMQLRHNDLIHATERLKEECREQKAFIDIVSKTVDELFIGFEAKRVESFDGHPEDQPFKIHKRVLFSGFSNAGNSRPINLDAILNTMHKIGFDVCIDALNSQLHAYVRVNGEKRVAYAITKDGYRLLPKEKLINEISKNLAEFMKRPEFKFI